MLDPLLRSTNVLNALFHSGAIVCEGDSDRCFYQEINHRLLNADSMGVRDSIFLNAQNKQTIRRIIEPLRQMGIAAAAVLDFDIIKDGDLTGLLNACGIPHATIQGIGATRALLQAHFKDHGLDHEKGLAAVDGEMRTAAQTLVEQLKSYGVFVVPFGALESWFTELQLTSRKGQWLAEVFGRMGNDPEGDDYMRPSDGSVWDFVRDIAKWVADPNRAGMPAT